MKKTLLLAPLLFCLLSANAQQWKLAGNGNTDPSIHFLGTTNDNDLVFRTNNSERARFLSAGDFQIGDAVNHALFNTQGDLILSGTADYLLNGNRYLWRDFSDGDIGMYYNAFAQRMEMRNNSASTTSYLTTDGHQYIADKISIGSESFAYKLTVENNTTLRSAFFNNSYNSTGIKYGVYNLVSGDGTGSRYGIYNSSTSNASSTASNYGIYNTVSNPGTGKTYGSYNYINSPGNDSHYGYYASLNTAGTNTQYGLYVTYSGAGTGTRYGVYSSASGASHYAFYGVGRGYFSDKLGIGTNSPAVMMEVNGTEEVLRLSGTDPYLKIRNGATDVGFVWANGIDMTLGTDGNNDDGKIVLRTNTVGRLFVNSSGNVGIGLSDPLSKLHVDGSDEVMRISGVSDPYLQFAQDGIKVGFVQASGEDLRIGLNQDNLFGVMRFSTSGTTRMLIDGNGNIGIGIIDTEDLAAGYRLSVNGKVICEELRVELDSSWPDYVFEEEYQLMSLDELRKFVRSNHHLPGIPTAEKITEDGLQVGAMQADLLKKMEELTLYILQLEERLSALEQN